MSQCLELLEQALDAGQRELDYIASGDVDTLAETARERSRLIEEAWSLRDADSVCLDDLLAKLQKLRSLQGKLSREARVLHSSLAEDLARVKKQGRRLAGYGKASKITPMVNRFVSKQG